MGRGQRKHDALSEHEGVFLTQRALKDSGYGGLDYAVIKSGGYAHWRSDFGLELFQRNWKEASIRAALRTWMSEHEGVFPTQRALKDSGYGGLADAVIKSGGYAHWPSEFGSSARLDANARTQRTAE